jgi:hypothetical protein
MDNVLHRKSFMLPPGVDADTFNLTLKETHFLKWFDTYCGQVRYIFKGDDDVFVSVDNILEYLEGSGHAKGLLVGDVLFKAKPIRRKSNKYYIPEALYNKTFYPPYAGGGGFVMDGPLVRRLHWASETLELFTGVMLRLLEAQGPLPLEELHAGVVSACLSDPSTPQARRGTKLRTPPRT